LKESVARGAATLVFHEVYAPRSVGQGLSEKVG
jgi:hypothetical protein